MTQQHVVITGANRGIGLELARHYHHCGWQVTGVCRESSPELEEAASRVMDGTDITHQEQIQSLAAALQGMTIDLLINNAGVMQDDVLGELDVESLRLQMEVNAFAPLRLVEALLPSLQAGSKIANITSRMGSITDNTSGGYYGYRASKAAFNAIGQSLAVDLRDKGIAVIQLHPGYVQTRMTGFKGMIPPEQAAAGLADRIEALSLENTGSFRHSQGEELPW